MELSGWTLCGLLAFAFCLGLNAGRWDAKHGGEVGYKAGKAVREFFTGGKHNTPTE